MIKRRRTKFENWFSFNQHKKRFGAKALQQELNQVDYNQLKTTIIAGTEVKYTYGSDKNLVTHINALMEEFSGQSGLLYYHAKLIVLIRREADLKTNFILFEQLWENEANYLLDHLNSRWLVAAADTFADHSLNAENRAYAIAISCLMNTIKLVETERYLQKTWKHKDDEQQYKILSQQRVPLFDGLSAFAVGTDDSLRNMRWRMNKHASKTCSYRILHELYVRIQSEDNDNVFSRFRKRHTRKKTAWW